MKKGKIKKQKKYLSVVLVPHSSDKVKVFKLSGLYPKLVLLAAAVTGVLLSLGLFAVHTYKENTALRKSVASLSGINAEQQSLLDEKAVQISELKTKEDEMDKRTAEYVRKFSELTDKYISGKTNRSGSSVNDRTFVSDLNELKKLLDSINKEDKAADKAGVDLAETEAKLKKYMETIPTLWPTSGRITSNFGERNDPFYFSKRYHEGLDIAADWGQNIKAAANGTVTFSGWNGNYGYVVFIDHGRDISTVYGHASRLLVKKGQEVKKGDIIAKVGSSGRSTGSHLHYEIRINDEPVDPLKYLSNN